MCQYIIIIYKRLYILRGLSVFCIRWVFECDVKLLGRCYDIVQYVCAFFEAVYMT